MAMRWEGHSLELTGGRRWHLGVERGKMQERLAPRAVKREMRRVCGMPQRRDKEDVRMFYLCWRA